MPSLFVSVDKTSGNYEDSFIYTINASFNGITGNINSAKIKLFIPDFLNVFLGDVKDPIKNVVENSVVGGKEIIFDFESLTDLGIAVRIGFGITFKADTINETSFICTPQLLINDEETLSATADEIMLSLTPQFEISRAIVLPVSSPASRSAVFYKLTLENFKDLGAEIENVVITCSGTDILVLDSEFSVIGKDVSDKFADTSSDDIQGVFNNNILTFTIPKYKGQRYEFIYRAVIASDLEVGSEISSVASFSIDNQPSVSELHEVTLSSAIYNANISIYAPDYSLADEYICYRLNIENTGNQILRNSVFKNELPSEVLYYKFNTGSFNIGALKENLSAEYFIDYSTINGLTGTIGPYNTDVNTSINLADIIPDGDNLATITWNLNSLGIGVQSKASPQLLGIIKSDTAIDTSIINHIHLEYDDETERNEKVENATTLIANYCILNPNFSSTIGNNPTRPGDIFSFSFSANCRNSRLKNPIFAFLMPKELEYIGNEDYSYSDIFASISPVNPPVVLIENFNENADTLVKFEFINEYEFNFRQLANIKINFDVTVKIGSLGNISSFLLLNTLNSTGVIPNTTDIYQDKNDIAQNPNVSKNYAKSNTIKNTILYFVSTSSNKKVKGLLDSEYIEEPLIGKTVSGGSLEYLITIKNIGNANLENIEIVDILPFIGDTGVIQTNQNRGSEFSIYAISEVVAIIMPENENVEFDIFYSKSSDPLRFGAKFNTIGTDNDWTQEVFEDLSQLKAFKVKTKNTIIKPNEMLKIAITASVPIGATVDSVAWNSFAADVSYLDLSNKIQHLLAIEPEKVGIKIADNQENTVKISGYAFLDDNADGYFNNDENYLNDVIVTLYDENQNLIRYTSTAPSFDKIDGQYGFENLPIGKYYIKFIIDDKKLKFTQQKVDSDNGSKPFSKTGTTQLLDLTNTSAMNNINVGILPKGKYTLAEILKINNQTRGVVRDVIKNQMLLTMKQEDVIDLLENSK